MWERRWRSRGFLVLMAVAVLALLAGCGGDSESSSTDGADGSDSEPVKLALFGFAAENAYTQAILDGVEEGAAEDGAEVEFFDGKFDPTAQAGQIQDATASGAYDGFLITPIDPPSVAPVASEAIEQGIEVATLQFNIGKELNDEVQVEGLAVRATYGYEGAAILLGERVVELCGEKDSCNVVVLWGERASLFEAARRTGLLSVLDEHSNIELIAEPDAGYLREPAYAAMQDVLQQGEEIDVVMTASGDQMIAGAQKALEEAGIAVGTGDGEVKLIGNSAAETAVKGVAAGQWDGTYLAMPVTMGRIAENELTKAIRGEPYEEYIDMGAYHPDCADSQYVDEAFLESCPDFVGEWDG